MLYEVITTFDSGSEALDNACFSPKTRLPTPEAADGAAVSPRVLKACVAAVVAGLSALAGLTPSAAQELQPLESLAALPPVITSYSIHYTKLYERHHRGGKRSRSMRRELFVAASRSLPSGSKIWTTWEEASRITSYNVCYTKLLRAAAPRGCRGSPA